MHNCKTCGGGLIHIERLGDVCPYCGNGYLSDGTTIPAKQSEQFLDSADLYEKCVTGVMEISVRNGKGQGGSGSGYLIDANGLAITNAHVVLEEKNKIFETIFVRICNKVIKAKVIKCGSPEGVDLALIRLENVPSNATPLKLEKFENVRNGEKVYVIGNPKGEGISITSGIVSDRLRDVFGQKLLMTDCTINPGNSGGPMFNQKGHVIGTVVSKRTDADNMNYAVPVLIVQEFINK